MAKDPEAFELKYRPLNFDELIGWEAEKKSLLSLIKTKQTFLLYGPRGCGKTTIGRLIAYELNIDDIDIKEIDAASNTGVDDARAIKANVSYSPLKGKCKIYIIDEVHRLTGNAFDALLKTLEEPPQHCYFVLCSSEIDKIPATIKSRCAKYEVKPLNTRDSLKLLDWVCGTENIQVAKEVKDAIIDQCEGIPREMIISLDMIKDMKDQDEAISLIFSNKEKPEIIDLCRALLNKGKWTEISQILKNLTDDPEKVRMAVAGYLSKVLLSKENDKAATILSYFTESFIYSKKPGLILACYMSVGVN